jgi:large-conductance mechanosensitive channel
MGGVDFVNLTIRMKNFVYVNQPAVVIRYGRFLQTIISLFLIGLVLFFLVKGINELHHIAKRKKPTKPNEELAPIVVNDELKVLHEIRDLLARQTTIIQ